MLGVIVGLIVFVSSLSRGGDWFEALIGGVLIGGIVGGLVKMGKDRVSS